MSINPAPSWDARASPFQPTAVSAMIGASRRRPADPERAPLWVTATERVAWSIRLASGLVRQWNRPDDLRRWAFIILAASFIDLGELEQHPQGDALLNMVWDAGFGVPMSSDMFGLAQRVATPR